MDDDEDIRAPDAAIQERLIGNDDDLDDLIARLMAQGLNEEEARNIALSDIQENNQKSKSMVMENKLAQLKAMNVEENLQRKQARENAKEQQRIQEEGKISQLDKLVLDCSRRLTPQNQKLVNAGLAYYKTHNSQMTITEEELSSLEEELNKMKEIKRLNVSKETVNKIMDLFTTPVEEINDEDYEYDEEYGGSSRRRRHKTKRHKTKRHKTKRHKTKKLKIKRRKTKRRTRK